MVRRKAESGAGFSTGGPRIVRPARGDNLQETTEMDWQNMLFSPIEKSPVRERFFLSIYLRMNLLQGCVSLVNFNNATVRTLTIVHRVFVLSISIGSKKICIYLLNVTMIKLTLPIFCTHGSCTDFPRFFYSQSANLLSTGSILEEIHS